MKKDIHQSLHQKIWVGFMFAMAFVLIMISLWSFGDDLQQMEQQRAEETLANLAIQGATVVEDKIESVAYSLVSVSQILKDHEDYKSSEAIEHLKKVVFESDVEIVRMGVADENGEARTTEGEEIQVSNRTFFKEAMKGKVYISGTMLTTLSDSESLLIAVPVFDMQENTIGVIYSIIRTTNFELYSDSLGDMKQDVQYIHVIDNQGNYIVRSKNNNTILDGYNFYDDIEKVNSSIPVDEMKKSLNGKKPLLTTMQKGSDVRYVYMAPIEINNWCVVTVLKGDVISNRIKYSGDAVNYLIVKIVIILVVLGIFLFCGVENEKRKIVQLNQELTIGYKVFRIALGKVDYFVFSYDWVNHELKFLNYDADKIRVPQILEDFPHSLTKYMNVEKETNEEIHRLFKAVENGAREENGEITLPKGEESLVYRIRLTAILNEDGKAVRIVGTLEDVTEEKRNEVRIRKSEQFRLAMLSDSIGFFEVNLDKDCVMRDGQEHESEYTFSEILHYFCERKVAPRYREKVKKTFEIKNLRHLYTIGVCDKALDYARISEEGEEFWVRCEIHMEKDAITGELIAIAVIRNINDKKKKELLLKEQAVLDPLTKAYNRVAGRERINKILKEESDTTHAFLLIDLDNFKNINDKLGHLGGDRVLIDAVSIMRRHVRSSDVVCRIGGDEFVIFMKNIPEDVVPRNVTKLLKKLNLTYERAEKFETVSGSVGIAMAPRSGMSFEELYEHADIALYQVKNESKNNYKIYEE